jgi:ABC-type glycerol-3-phosphate transport system permease component
LAGLPAQRWLSDPDLAIWSVIAVAFWKSFGLKLLIFLGAPANLPKDVAEAARIDGAGPWRQMLEIGLPNIGGAVSAMAVLSFLGAWNLYLWPHLILDATEHKTLSIGLKLFATTGEQGGQWGPLMATALLAALPVVALYLVAQRQLIPAFATSGVR